MHIPHHLLFEQGTGVVLAEIKLKDLQDLRPSLLLAWTSDGINSWVVDDLGRHDVPIEFRYTCGYDWNLCKDGSPH